MSERAEHSKNAGLTLVELLVAVTMLSIIVVPLLHAFVTSARLGLKARKGLRITTAAQDIMEGLKAESVESLSCSFNYPDDDVDGTDPGDPIPRTANSFDNFHLVIGDLVGKANSGKLYELRATVVEDETAGNYRSVSNLEDISARSNTHMANFGSSNPADADRAATTKAITVPDPADNTKTLVIGYDFYGKSDKKYYFAIQDMHVEGDETNPNLEVDALIELDGSNYTSKGVNKKKSSDNSTKALLNDHGRISYGALNEKRDAFFIQDEPLLRQTVQDFNNRYHPLMADVTDSDLAKKYVITVTNQSKKDPLDDKLKAEGGDDWITVTCEITYTSSAPFLIPHEHTDYDSTKGGDQPYQSVYTYTIFDNKATGYLPDNIFLCYYPGYGAKTQHEQDEIIYVNPDCVPSVFHIVKQEGKNNGTLNTDELNYKCRVRIHEGTGATADTPGLLVNRKDSVTQIRTNLDTNLYKIYLDSAPDSRNQATYVYNNTTLVRDFTKPQESGIYTLGGEPATSDSMYDVTIDIYEKDTLANALSTDKKISNDKILFTLKGSMN